MSNQKVLDALREHLLDVLAHVVLNYLQFQLAWAGEGLWRMNPRALLKNDKKTAAISQGRPCLTDFCADRPIGVIPAITFSYSVFCGPMTDLKNCPYVGLTISPCDAVANQADVSSGNCIFLQLDPDRIVRAVNGERLDFLHVPVPQMAIIKTCMQTSYLITVDKALQTIEIDVYSHEGPSKHKVTAKPFVWGIGKGQFDQLVPFVTLYREGDSAQIQLETPNILDIQ